MLVGKCLREEGGDAKEGDDFDIIVAEDSKDC
jgi:hypothetical protein